MQFVKQEGQGLWPQLLGVTNHKPSPPKEKTPQSRVNTILTLPQKGN